MGVIVDVIEEVRLRLEAAKAAGALPVKAVFVGSYEEPRSQENFPVVNIDLTGVRREDENLHMGVTDILDIEIRYIDHRMVANSNKIYKTSDSSGPIFYLEKLLDTMETNRSTSTGDLNLAGTSHDTYSYSTYFDYSVAGCIHIVVRMSVKTARFMAGSR